MSVCVWVDVWVGERRGGVEERDCMRVVAMLPIDAHIGFARFFGVVPTFFVLALCVMFLLSVCPAPSSTASSSTVPSLCQPSTCAGPSRPSWIAMRTCR